MGFEKRQAPMDSLHGFPRRDGGADKLAEHPAVFFGRPARLAGMVQRIPVNFLIQSDFLASILSPKPGVSA